MVKFLLQMSLFAFLLCFHPVKAHEVENEVLVTGWTTKGEASTYVISAGGEEIELSEWVISISTSRGGETRIYIDVMGSFNECDESILPKVLDVDGRQVSMQPLCYEYIDSKQYYVSFTPATDEGLEYIVNTFKNKPSDDWVIIGGFGDALGDIKPFSTDGFTDAYELNRVL